MQIFKNFSFSALKNIVEFHAKFQKVMLVYDENVSNVEIAKIYDCIKDVCIFNKTEIDCFSEAEISDGYKLIIFICAANSFLKINFNLSEFVNVFLPTNFEILPFFIDENFKAAPIERNDEITVLTNSLSVNPNYIFLKQGVDISIFYSYYFNYFLARLNEIFTNEELTASANFNAEFFNQNVSVEFLKNNFVYRDVKMLKELKLDYKYLPFLDYYFLLAFLLMITAIKQKTLTLVDVYKAAKNDYSLLDKFYAKINNDAFFQLIDINFASLKNILVLSIKNLQKLTLKDLSNEEKNNLIEKIKTYCKNSNDYFVYLYLFNIFSL